MKTYLSFLTLGLLALTACNAPQGAQSRVYNDDIYYSSKDASVEKEQRQAEAAKQAQQKAEEDRRQAEATSNANNNNQQNTAAADDYYSPDNNANANVNNNNGSANYTETPFNYDDYYDNEYAARIRRFDNPSPNYGYYDNYYTNSYFYTGNPYNYGSSIYMGYNFWGPTYTNYMYNPGFNWYSNMGWGYDPFYSPYGYNPYSPYGYGYNQGYYNGFYNGYNNNYFNSYDNNSYDNSYYGARGTTGSNGRQTAQPTSLAHRYMATVEAETNKPFDETKGRDNNPYMLHTTVSDYTTASRPVGTNNNINKPTGTVNPGYTTERGGNKPVTNTGPTVESKQNNEPVYNNNNYYNRQNSAQKQTPHYEQQQPKYERQQPKYEQQQSHNESPKFERGSSSSPSSSPRSSSSGSSSRPRR